jgi:hypothetical protein
MQVRYDEGVADPHRPRAVRGRLRGRQRSVGRGAIGQPQGCATSPARRGRPKETRLRPSRLWPRTRAADAPGTACAPVMLEARCYRLPLLVLMAGTSLKHLEILTFSMASRRHATRPLLNPRRPCHGSVPKASCASPPSRSAHLQTCARRQFCSELRAAC